MIAVHVCETHNLGCLYNLLAAATLDQLRFGAANMSEQRGQLRGILLLALCLEHQVGQAAHPSPVRHGRNVDHRIGDRRHSSVEIAPVEVQYMGLSWPRE